MSRVKAWKKGKEKVKRNLFQKKIKEYIYGSRGKDNSEEKQRELKEKKKTGERE